MDPTAAVIVEGDDLRLYLPGNLSIEQVMRKTGRPAWWDSSVQGWKSRRSNLVATMNAFDELGFPAVLQLRRPEHKDWALTLMHSIEDPALRGEVFETLVACLRDHSTDTSQLEQSLAEANEISARPIAGNRG